MVVSGAGVLARCPLIPVANEEAIRWCSASLPPAGRRPQFVVPARLLWMSTPIAARQAKRNTTSPSPIQRDAFCARVIVYSRLPFHFGADSSDGLEHRRRPYSDASEPGTRNKAAPACVQGCEPVQRMVG